MLSVRGGDRNEATVDYHHHLQYSNHHQRRCSFSAMDDNELEEGEAYTGSDPNFDPDVDLSYIDIKLQDVLGHFQKDFEGGVSAENLGAKYGGYGSFLPTHQRSPSVLLQNKMQAGIQNNDITRPLVDSGAEKMLSAAQNNGTKYVQSASVNASNTSAINLGDMSQKVGPSADVGKVNRQQSPSKKLSSKSNSTGDRKKLKLKIKMAPEPQQHGNNSALYNQLGLKITPSPSLEDSPINSQGCSLEGDSSLPSPLSIIQMMTFFEIPGGSLLSPLRDVLVKFPERFEKMASREQVRNRADTEPFEASTPAKEEIDVSKMSQSLKEKRGAWNENRSKYTNIKRDAAEPDLGRIHKNSIKISSKATSSDIYQGQVDTEYMADATKVGSKVPGESGKRKSKEKKLKAGSLKDESSDADRNRQTNKINDIEYGISPVPSDKQSYKLKVSDFSRENKEGASHKILKSEGKWSLSEMVKEEKNAVQSKVLTNNREKSNHKTDSIDGFEDRLTGKEILDEDAASLKGIKKKHKDVNSKMTSSKESIKEKSRDIINEPFKDSRIDKFRKDSLMSEPSSDLAKIRKESKHAAKIRQKDYHKGGLDLSSGKKDGVIYHRDGVKDAKQGSTDKTCSRMMENEKDREKLLTKSSSSKRLDHTSKAEDQVPVTTTHQPLTVGMGNETTGIPLAAPPQAQPQNPVVINEEWVMCDRCEKWRLLPFGPPMQLPKQWVCSMLSWLPNMNRCDISEDATTHALYALFGMQPPQAQVPGDGNDNPMQPSGALVQEPVPDMKHIDSIPGGKSRNATSYSAKKEEGPSGVTGSFVATSTSLKANKQTFSKSKNLNDVQLPAHKVQGLKGDDYMEGSKNRQKEKLKSKQSSADEGWDVGMGNSHTLKTKRKGETEYDMQKSVKKIKSEDVGFDACKNSLDTCSNGKIGPNNGDFLPSKTVVGKAKRYFKDSPSTKDLKGQKKDALLTTEKQAKEQFQTSLDTDSRGTYSSFDTDKFARKDLQGKKRKAIHDKENITEPDGFTDKDYDGGYGNPKEDFSVTEYRKGKKTKISCSEGKASSTSKAEGKGEKIRAGSKNSLVKDIFSNGLEERNRGINEQDHIVSQSQPRGVVRRYSNGSDVPKRELVSAAAPASSSSKMSCSLKNVANANEERASPMESVSSSPFRSYKAEKLSSSRKNGFRTDDMIDSGLNGMASHGRCSDAEDDNRSYHSSPSKFDRVTVQDDLRENSRVIKVSKNRKSVEEKLEKSKKQSVNVNSKTGKHHKNMEKSNNDSRPSSLAHKYSRESLDLPEQQDKQSNERKDREYSHSKYNKDRENLTRVQEKEHNRNETPMRGKGKLNDSLSDSHEEFPVGKDASSKWHDEPLEGRNQSPYQERYKLSKEYPVTEKNVVKHDRERKSDLEWNAKNDARGKMPGDAGGKGNKIKIEKGENVDTNVSGIRPKSSKDSLTRHLDCGMPSKDGKPNLQQSSKQETGHGSVKKSAQAMNSRNVQSTSALSKGKSQVPGIESKLDSRDCNIEVKGNNSGSGISAKKGAYGVTANVNDINLPASKESIKISNTDGASIKAISRIEKEVVAASPVRRECSQSPGQAVLKEATLLKHTADRLKNNGGDEFDFLRLYFEAALKFLLAASLLEPSNSEGSKIGEKNLSMKVYTDTAQLCRYCASQFEKIKEMAAAALAYKCMAVAHMRVVLFKTTCLNRDFLELQSSFQNAPPGESPSSSASDVDNLNNHVLMEKSTTALVKVDESSQVSGNHVIPSRQLPNFRRLLQYTHDVTASIEAFKKSETAFAVAVKMSDASNRTKEIPAVKTVIDFSFHDIEGLLRLVRLAMEALHH